MSDSEMSDAAPKKIVKTKSPKPMKRAREESGSSMKTKRSRHGEKKPTKKKKKTEKPTKKEKKKTEKKKTEKKKTEKKKKEKKKKEKTPQVVEDVELEPESDVESAAAVSDAESEAEPVADADAAAESGAESDAEPSAASESDAEPADESDDAEPAAAAESDDAAPESDDAAPESDDAAPESGADEDAEMPGKEEEKAVALSQAAELSSNLDYVNPNDSLRVNYPHHYFANQKKENWKVKLVDSKSKHHVGKKTMVIEDTSVPKPDWNLVTVTPYMRVGGGTFMGPIGNYESRSQRDYVKKWKLDLEGKDDTPMNYQRTACATSEVWQDGAQPVILSDFQNDNRKVDKDANALVTELRAREDWLIDMVCKTPQIQTAVKLRKNGTLKAEGSKAKPALEKAIKEHSAKRDAAKKRLKELEADADKKQDAESQRVSLADINRKLEKLKKKMKLVDRKIAVTLENGAEFYKGLFNKGGGTQKQGSVYASRVDRKDHSSNIKHEYIPLKAPLFVDMATVDRFRSNGWNKFELKKDQLQLFSQDYLNNLSEVYKIQPQFVPYYHAGSTKRLQLPPKVYLKPGDVAAFKIRSRPVVLGKVDDGIKWNHEIVEVYFLRRRRDGEYEQSMEATTVVAAPGADDLSTFMSEAVDEPHHLLFGAADNDSSSSSSVPAIEH